jgi:putative SOS response-associated peptidase YedK
VCGRFASALPPEELARIFAVTGALPNTAPSWNVAPTQPAVAVRLHPDSGARTLGLLTWGLLPFFTKDPARATRPINARAETVATSGMFRDAFLRRRCLVPADAYYEWQTTPAGKVPHAIARVDGAPLALGGLWEGYRAADGEVTRSFAIITVPANAALAHLHARMPLVLESRDWAGWLGEAQADPAALLQPAPEAALRAWHVGKAVGNVRNNGAALLEESKAGGDEAVPPIPPGFI